MRTCKWCNKELINKRSDAICCSQKCAKDSRHRSKYPVPAKRLTPEQRIISRRERKKHWKLKNIDKYRAHMRAYCRNRYKKDINYKLAINIRNRMSVALNGMFKNGRTIDLLDCSIQDLKVHLESKFLPSMTWQNHGSWHIDHIQPLSSFDLSDPEQLKQACHYSNLQPLWAEENIRKGNKNPH